MNNNAEISIDATLTDLALHRPHSYYLEWAEDPEVDKALRMFISEKGTRKTVRFDLVAWVQYICGFGHTGPSNEAWAGLFAACRLFPMLGGKTPFLSEHEISVLLTYAKIEADPDGKMTPARFVKNRIKPAILGRKESRTPGILEHIHVKFENWALGQFTDLFCSNFVAACDPRSFVLGIEDIPTTQFDIGESIRKCTDAHTNALLQIWEDFIISILDFETYATTQRARKFCQTLNKKSKDIYEHIFTRISEYWFILTRSRASFSTYR